MYYAYVWGEDERRLTSQWIVLSVQSLYKHLAACFIFSVYEVVCGCLRVLREY